MSFNHTGAVTAYETNSLGYSVNAQGYLLFYALGVIKLLGDIGLVGPSTTIAATGTASLVTAAVCSKTPYDHILGALQIYWNASHDPLMLLDQRRALLRQAADDMLPANAHALCQPSAFIASNTALHPKRSSSGSGSSNGSSSSSTKHRVSFEVGTRAKTPTAAAHTAVREMAVNTDRTQEAAVPEHATGAKPSNVPVFADRSALLDAVVGSSFPPAPAADDVSNMAQSQEQQQQQAPKAAAVVAAVQLVQQVGSASGFVPACPSSVRYCVRVTAIPPMEGSQDDSRTVGTAGSSRSSNSSTKQPAAAPKDLTIVAEKSATAALAPSKVATMTSKGAPPAAAAAAGGVGNLTGPAAAAIKAAAVAATPAHTSSAADIYPGLSQALGISRSDWLSYMVVAPSIQVLSYMHYLGRVDAYMWANATGLVKAAVAEQQEQLTAQLLHRITSLDSVDALFKGIVNWPGGRPIAGHH